jgi:tight adherence protein B
VEYFIVLAVFGFIMFLVMGLIKTISKKDVYQDRLNMINESFGEKEQEEADKKRVTDRIGEAILKIFASQSLKDNIQAQLIRAGLPLRSEEFIVICLFFILFVPLLLAILVSNTLVAIMALIIGLFIPKIYLDLKKNKRLQLFNSQLGDALIVMANALRAGFGFQQAMDTVRREMPDPLATEFTWTLREMNLGISQDEALLNMGQRVKSDDLDLIITGIIIQKQVGGNLAEILENISGTIRERARIKKEIKVLTAQGRLSGIIIGVLPIILIFAMLTINPDYFNKMLHNPLGIMFLGAGAVLEVIGMLVIRKITDIEL